MIMYIKNKVIYIIDVFGFFFFLLEFDLKCKYFGVCVWI